MPRYTRESKIAPKPARLQEVFSASAGVRVGELLVPFGTKKGVRSEQGTGTYPGDDRKPRTCAGVRQPDQCTRAEGPIGAAARQSEDADRLSPRKARARRATLCTDTAAKR